MNNNFEIGTKVWVVDTQTDPNHNRCVISGTIKDFWEFSNMYFPTRKEYRVELNGPGFRSFLYSEEDVFDSEQDSLDVMKQRELGDLTFDEYQKCVGVDGADHLPDLIESVGRFARLRKGDDDLCGDLGNVLMNLTRIISGSGLSLSEIAYMNKLWVEKREKYAASC